MELRGDSAMSNITVSDIVQHALDNETKMPLLVNGTTAVSLREIIKIRFPAFSNSHINRLIHQNAVKINGNLIDGQSIVIFNRNIVIQVGKRNYFRLTID